MKRAAIAGFAAGAAMMIGGALAAVSGNEKIVPETNYELMNPMIGGQAMLPDRDIMENIAASPMHTALALALKDSGVAGALKSNGQFTVFAPTNAAMAAAGPQSNAAMARRMSSGVFTGRPSSENATAPAATAR